MFKHYTGVGGGGVRGFGGRVEVTAGPHPITQKRKEKNRPCWGREGIHCGLEVGGKSQVLLNGCREGDSWHQMA